MKGNPVNFATRLKEVLDGGETVCLVTAIQSNLPEFPAGTKVLFFRDGSSEGSLPSGETGRLLPALAKEALALGRRHTAQPIPGFRVFLDVLAPEIGLLICGAGHVAVPLASFARELGFRVTVLDDRPDFADTARFPGCEVLVDDFAPALRSIPMGPATYAVVITRGHEHDFACLSEILLKETAYVGLIGSRRRVEFVKIALQEKGIAPERVEDLFTPIGLPIGAESPAEIAICIAAELVAVRRLGSRAARSVRGGKEGES